VATLGAKAQSLRAATQRRQAAALKAWNPSDKPDWLDEKTYREQIRPRIAGITVPAIMSALAVSAPYATNIRAGRCMPHARHWLTLARLVGVAPEEWRKNRTLSHSCQPAFRLSATISILFENCIFRNCDIMYFGGPAETSSCYFENAQWIFEGAAGTIITVMQGLGW
jgi:hypothetical protein